VIEATPKTPDVATNSGYGKRKVWIREDNHVAVKGEYWDAAGAPVKQLTARDVREIDRRPGSLRRAFIVIASRSPRSSRPRSVSLAAALGRGGANTQNKRTIAGGSVL
jgi:hypothetical protein